MNAYVSHIRRIGLVSFAVLIGWGLGVTAAKSLAATAIAQTSCFTIESIDFSDAPQSIRDTDDGVDEDNRWRFHGGQDFGRSLACNDGSGPSEGLNGQDQNDDVGGGSGDDVVSGGLNNDQVFGGLSTLFGQDELRGGDGADTLWDLESDDFDVAFGNNGDDIINVLDGDGLDNAVGSNGVDDCNTDNGDTRDSCET